MVLLLKTAVFQLFLAIYTFKNMIKAMGSFFEKRVHAQMCKYSFRGFIDIPFWSPWNPSTEPLEGWWTQVKTPTLPASGKQLMPPQRCLLTHFWNLWIHYITQQTGKGIKVVDAIKVQSADLEMGQLDVCS